MAQCLEIDETDSNRFRRNSKMKQIPSSRDIMGSTVHLDLGFGNRYSAETEHLFEID
jgi:hypothetical protein